MHIPYPQGTRNFSEDLRNNLFHQTGNLGTVDEASKSKFVYESFSNEINFNYERNAKFRAIINDKQMGFSIINGYFW